MQVFFEKNFNGGIWGRNEGNGCIAIFLAGSFASRTWEVLVMENLPRAVHHNSSGICNAKRLVVATTSPNGITG